MHTMSSSDILLLSVDADSDSIFLVCPALLLVFHIRCCSSCSVALQRGDSILLGECGH